MRRKKDESPENDPKPAKGVSRAKRRRVAAPVSELAAEGPREAFAAEAASLTVSEPADGARKLLHTRVTFRGTATPPVVEVRAFATDAPSAGPLFVQSVNAEGRWEHDREFTRKGDRPLRVEGLAANGDVAASVELSIHLFVGLGGYQPPDDAIPLLGKIVGLLEDAENVKPATNFVGGDRLFKLPGGAFYMVSDLDVDTDGSGPDHGDDNHQDSTSLSRKPGVFVNADEDAYFVLNTTIAHLCGMRLGDVAAVIFRNTLAFALYADNQDDKVGEGSMALHAALGNPVTDPNTQGLDAGAVITILFPGSRSTSGTGYRKPEKVIEVAQAAFDALAQG